jgi:hypothetical protein
MAAPVPWSRPANGTLMAQTLAIALLPSGPKRSALPLSCGLDTERVTRIELALSAWESVQRRPVGGSTSDGGKAGVSARTRDSPRLMAR